MKINSNQSITTSMQKTEPVLTNDPSFFMLQGTRRSYRKCTEDREKYADLLQWLSSKLSNSTQMLKQEKITQGQKTSEDKQAVLSCLQTLSELTAKQCYEKGLSIKLCTQNIINIMNSMKRQYELSCEEIMKKIMNKEEETQLFYIDKIQALKKQLKELKEQYNNKWKSSYMIVKDNRVLRRQKGKILRRLYEETMRVKLTQQSLLKAEKELEKNRVLFTSEEDVDVIRRFVNNRTSLNKLQRIIDKYPSKARKRLLLQLQKLQIVQLNTLDQKVEFIIKAMKDVEDIYGEHDDLCEDYKESHLLYNVYTQTDIETEERAVNTNTIEDKIMISVSAYTKPVQLKHFRETVIFQWHLNYVNEQGNEKNKKIIVNQSPIINIRTAKNSKRINKSGITIQNGKEGRSLEKFFSNTVRSFPMKNSLDQLNRKSNARQKSIVEDSLGVQICSKVYQLDIFPQVETIKIHKSHFLRSQNVQQISQSKKNRKLLNQEQTSREKVLKKSHYYNNEKFKGTKTNDFLPSTEKMTFLRMSSQVFNYTVQYQESKNHERRRSKVNYGLPNPKFVDSYVESGVNKRREDKNHLRVNIIKSRFNDTSKSITYEEEGFQYASIKQAQAIEQFRSENQREFIQGGICDKKLTTGYNLSTIQPEEQSTISQMKSSRNIRAIKKKIAKMAFTRMSCSPKQIDANLLVNYSEKKSISNLKDIKETQDIKVSCSMKKNTKDSKDYLRKSEKPKESDQKSFKKLSSRNTARKGKNVVTENNQEPNKISPLLELSYRTYSYQNNHNNELNFLMKNYENRPSQFQKVMRSVLKNLYQRRKELLNSNFTMLDFLKSQFQCSYGIKNSLQSFLNNLCQISLQKVSMIMSFQIMLSTNGEKNYLRDLLKIYITMLDKNGSPDILAVDKDKSNNIMECLINHYLNGKTVQQIQRAPSRRQSIVDLNDYFITLAVILRNRTANSELSHFLTQILPPSQHSLTFQQIKQLTGIFEGTPFYVYHLFRLKAYNKQSVSQYQFCLNASNQEWMDLINIESFVDRRFNQLFGTFVQEQCQKIVISCQFQGYSWIKALATQMLSSHNLYQTPINKILLKFMRILLGNSKAMREFPIPQTLNIISNCFNKLCLKKEIFTSFY